MFKNKKYSSIIFTVLALALLLIISACSNGATESTEPTEDATEEVDTDIEEAEDSEYNRPEEFTKRAEVIGYSVFDLQQPFWQSFESGIREAADEYGYDVVISDQKSSQEEQVSGSMNLINQDISALIVTPTQPSALPAIIDAAHEVGIPVVIGDIGVAGNYDGYVLSDNGGGGAQAADFLNDYLDETDTIEIGIIELHPGNVVGAERVNGFLEKIEEFGNFQVVSQLSGNDTVEGGFEAAQNMLSANPEIKAIFAANDPSAEGAVQALKQAGRLEGEDRVEVVGFNGDRNALELIQAGEMTATIAQDPVGMGRKTVEMAMDLLEGNNVDYTDEDHRTYHVPTELITIDNVDEFLE